MATASDAGIPTRSGSTSRPRGACVINHTFPARCDAAVQPSEIWRQQLTITVASLRGITMVGTVQFHRVLKAPPERVYRAFTDGDALAAWLPPTGFTGHVHAFDDVSVNSTYTMSFTNFMTGNSTNGTVSTLKCKRTRNCATSRRLRIRTWPEKWTQRLR